MINIKFDFNDILIVPSITTVIESRYRDITFPSTLPIITAPMDTVVDLRNIKLFLDQNIMVCLPRTIKPLNFYYWIKTEKHANKINNNDMRNVFLSVGFNELYFLYKNENILKTIPNILIDVANGHMVKIHEYCEKLKNINPDIKIMIGNIANPETYRWYAKKKCVDYIRCGIGNGGGCLTTKQTSVGYPMASLIYEIRKIKEQLIHKSYDEQKLPKIIADGGMKSYSDIIKAYALGADYVMLGSLLNKTIESSGDNYFFGIKINQSLAEKLYKRGFTIKKHFRGMSTKEAQKALGNVNLKTSEGVVRYRNVEYTLKSWIENYRHYLSSAMSYSNTTSISDFIGLTNIIQITKNSYDRFNK